MSDKVINKLFVCLLTIIFLFNNITMKKFQAYNVSNVFKIFIVFIKYSFKKLSLYKFQWNCNEI